MNGRIRNIAALASVAVTVLTACSATAEPASTSSPQPDDAAVWELQPGQRLQKSTTRFTALVTRVSCNSGVTGQVRAPDVRTTGTEVIVTFAVAATTAKAVTCLGNDQVPYPVELGGPLDGRTLVDGRCLPGEAGAGTAFCEPDAVRFRP